jgi:hypothetical protein
MQAERAAVATEERMISSSRLLRPLSLVVMLLASFLILLAINRLQRWSELRSGRA